MELPLKTEGFLCLVNEGRRDFIAVPCFGIGCRFCLGGLRGPYLIKRLIGRRKKLISVSPEIPTS